MFSDFGNSFWSDFWTALSAIGTIAAVITSLWLATKPYRKKIDLMLVWGASEYYCPQLIIHNLSDRTIVLKEVTFEYEGDTIGKLKILEGSSFKGYTVLSPKGVQQLEVPVFCQKDHRPGFEDKDGLYVPTEWKTVCRKERNLWIIIEDLGGKKYRAKQRYSKDKLTELYIGHGLLSDCKPR